MKPLVPIILFLTLFGCIPNEIVKGETIDNPDKRNENWCWFIDKETGQGKWVPVSDETNLPDGKYTLFYCDGDTREKGTVKNNEEVDTIFFFGKKEKLIFKKIILQDTILEVFEEGAYQYFYPNCELKDEGEFVNGIRVGAHIKYNKMGVVVMRVAYIDSVVTTEIFYDSGRQQAFGKKIKGKISGDVISWFPNGKIEKKLHASNGKLNGPAVIYFDNGNLELETNYVDNIETGLYVEYYRGGAISGRGNKINGEFDSTWSIYYENGSLEKTATYNNGIEQGKYMEFWEDGSILCEGEYINGKMDDLWVWNFENGQRDAEENYQLGMQYGSFKGYFESGQIKYHEEWINGSMEGEKYSYYSDGQLQFYGTYEDNYVTLYKEYDKRGKLIEEFNGKEVIKY